MCGIAGIYSVRGAVEKRDLLDMRDALTHRGPDDAGIWINKENNLGLAHRRLSIIDLSNAAHQPMTNEDESLVLVFNGEIYNFKELRKVLQEKGYRFKSGSDTEVVIHAYAEWGTASIEKLNGMFALALYDRNRNCLLLARDRFGEKPLYYYRHNGCFIFSSELKAMARFSGFSPGLDIDRLFLYFIFGYIPYPHTIFEHTNKLFPGHYLVLDLDSGTCTMERYWDELAESATEIRDPDGEILDQVEDLLTESVRLRMIADVPLGAFLSGGIDSSLIVSIAARMKANFKTFSIGFWDQHFDEAPHAKAVANHLGCDHYEHYVTPEEARNVLFELPGIYDEPFADSSAIPTYIVSQFAREQVKVVLTGDGGDELFGGYSSYGNFALAQPVFHLPGMLKELLWHVSNLCGTKQMKRHQEFLRIGELWQAFLYINERTIAKRPDVSRLLAANGEELLRNSVFVQSFAGALDRGGLQAALYTDMKTYLVDDNLVKVDRASMAVSLEARIPFLDPHLCRYALGLPQRAKMGIGGRKSKRILRQLLSRSLPPALCNRPKRGFSVPLGSWFRGELSWLLDEYLDKTKLSQEGLFNVEFVETVVAEHRSGERGREAILWALVFWEMWREKWRV